MARRRPNNDGSVFRENTGLWIAEIVVDGKKVRKRSKRQQVVLDWLKTAKEQVSKGSFVPYNQLTVADYFNQYLADAKDTVKPKTLDSYTYLIEKHIIPTIGDFKIASLRPEHIRTFLREKENLSARTRQYMFAVLRLVLNRAVKDRLIPWNPATAVTAPKPEKKTPDTLTVDQIKTFLEVVKDHRWYPIYLVAIGCGLREGEILGLEWRDIDLDGKVLNVRQIVTCIRGHLSFGTPKTELSRRSVAIPNFVIEALRPLKSDGLVFHTSSGRPISPRNLLRHFHESLAEANIPRVKFHSLRHSFATINLMDGTNPKVVQEMLGHSSVSLTLSIYSHTVPSLQKDAASKMNEHFKP